MHVVIFDGEPLSTGRIVPLLNRISEQSDCNNSFEITIAHTENEFIDALAQMSGKKETSPEEYFPFNSSEGFHLLDLSRICYFKSSKHHICAVLCDGTELYSKTVRVSARNILSPLLEQGRFVQIFKSCFVNVAHIRRVSPEGIQLMDGSILPVSRKYYSELIKERQKKLSRLRQDNTYRIMACDK